MKALATPEITTAQIVALVGAILGVAVAAGLDISDELQSQIINLVTILSSFLVAGDAVVRHGRSRALQNQPKGAVADDDQTVGGM